MSTRIAKVLDIDGEYRESPDSPIAVVREPWESEDGKVGEGMVVDPIYNHKVYNNLYGRIMTLVEATTDSHKLKAVKDLFSKEIGEWDKEVYQSARQLAEGKNSIGWPITNIYTR